MTNQILFRLDGKAFLDNIWQLKGWAQESVFIANISDNSGADVLVLNFEKSCCRHTEPTECTHNINGVGWMGARGVFLKERWTQWRRAWRPGSLSSCSCVCSHYFQPAPPRLILRDYTCSYCFFLFFLFSSGFVFSSLPLPMLIISHVMQPDLSTFCCWWNSVTVSNNFSVPRL